MRRAAGPALLLLLVLELQREVWFDMDASPERQTQVALLTLATLAAVVIMRRTPVLAVVLAFGGPLAIAGLHQLWSAAPATLLATIPVAFTLGRHTAGRRLLLGTILATGLIAATIAVQAAGGEEYATAITSMFSHLGAGLGPIWVGIAMRDRARLHLMLRERADALVRDRDAAAERVAVDERMRIAGDLHDVIAHAMSAMVIQASGARRLLQAGGAGVEAAFATVAETGRDALAEVRTMLGVLRSDGDPSSPSSGDPADPAVRSSPSSDDSSAAAGVAGSAEGLPRVDRPGNGVRGLRAAASGPRSQALRALAFDLIPAAVIIAVGLAEVVAGAQRGTAGLNTLVVVVLAGLVARRRHWPPVPVAAGWAAACILQSAFLATTQQASVGWLAYVFLTFALGRHAGGRASVVALAVMVAGIMGVYLVAPINEPGDFVFPEAIGVAIWLVGRTLRQRDRVTAQLRELATQAEERAERALALAQAQERRRLAREMHDVIAHSLSLMVVQAGGARRILATAPGRAAEAALLIEDTGREAMAELRQLLGILGSDLDTSGAPAPGLGQLDGLVGQAREAGLRVQVRERGALDGLPAGTDLAAYRIVQEALTNALRHAGRVETTVDLHAADGRLAIEVCNGPGQPTGIGGPPNASIEDERRTPGHGLVGMAERAHLYGGEFQAGATPDGGFRVAATLDLARPPVAA